MFQCYQFFSVSVDDLPKYGDLNLNSDLYGTSVWNSLEVDINCIILIFKRLRRDLTS
jgi:hypothetical protein